MNVSQNVPVAKGMDRELEDDEEVDEDVMDTTYHIWPAGQSHPLKVYWPCSTDIDTHTPCEWYVRSVRQGWVIAYTAASNTDNHRL